MTWELTLEPDGAAFTGRWRSGSDGEWLDITGLLAGSGPVETPAPAGGPLVLSRAELPGDLPETALEAVAGAAGYIAVGSSFDEDTGETAPLIVTSVDGRSWERVALTGDAAKGSMSDVVAFPGGYAAVGGEIVDEENETYAAQVWLSDDGVDWRRVEPHGGLLARRPRRRDGVAGWPLRPRGHEWPRLDIAGRRDMDPGRPHRQQQDPRILSDVGSGLDRLFVVGMTDIGGQGVILTSADGRTWTERLVEGTSDLSGVGVVGDEVIAAGALYTGQPRPG